MLWQVIAEIQAGEPLAPVTVAVPSPYAGLALRRGFTGSGRCGFANVRFMPLARIAELLGAPALAAQGRQPLPRAVVVHAVRAALREHDGPLRAVRDHPATIRSVAGAVAELRDLDDSQRARVAKESPRAAALVSITADVARRTRAFYDESDVLAAASAVSAGVGQAALRDLGPVVLHLPARLAPPEERFLLALAGRGALHAIVGLTGDPEADESARRLVEQLTGVLGPPDTGHPGPPPEPPVATTVVHAPDPVDEVREVARRIASRAGTVPLHRVAVLYRNTEPYARLVPEVLEEGGLTWNGPSTLRLAGTVTGRVLIGLLDLARSDFARDALAAWLASGPIVDPATHRPVPSHRWDLLSRQAGVVAGREQWSQRLDRLAREMQAALDGAGDEQSEGRRRGLERDLAEAAALRHFVAQLAQRLAPPDPGPWSTFVAWASALLHDHLGPARLRAAWPAGELEAGERILTVLDGLTTLDELDAACDLHAFHDSVTTALDVPAGRHGAFGTGVFAGPLRAAYGADFDLVFVVGMIEGAFPPRGLDDPLLPDDARRRAGSSLRLHAHRRLDERRDFLAALASGPERVLSFPRADPRAQRPNRPARWLLESASALSQGPLGADDLLDAPAAPWLVAVPSFEATLLDGDEPAAAHELDLGWLRQWQRAGLTTATHPLTERLRPLRDGLAAIAARAGERLGPFDGLVGPLPGLAPDAERATSPTTLEAWANCPFRYFLDHVLRVREVERPEATEALSAADRGSLVHEILERFVGQAGDITPGHRWSDVEREQLLAITRACCDKAEARGITGWAAIWRVERRRIERTVLALLDDDEAMRRELGVAPGALEWAFGIDGNPPVGVDLGDGRCLAFRGRVDRIDMSADGRRVVVLDYKTGSSRRYRGIDRDAVLGGRCLQLAVYAHAAELYAPGAELHAYYWFVGRPGSSERVGYHFDDARRARTRAVLRRMVDGIADGVFPAVPQERGRPAAGGGSSCGWCPYEPICPPDRDRIWERKQRDPAVAPYLALAHSEEER